MIVIIRKASYHDGRYPPTHTYWPNPYYMDPNDHAMPMHQHWTPMQHPRNTYPPHNIRYNPYGPADAMSHKGHR